MIIDTDNLKIKSSLILIGGEMVMVTFTYLKLEYYDRTIQGLGEKKRLERTDLEVGQPWILDKTSNVLLWFGREHLFLKCTFIQIIWTIYVANCYP